MAPSNQSSFLFLGPHMIYDYSCLMGPCGLFRFNRSICTWAFPCASEICCDIMWFGITRPHSKNNGPLSHRNHAFLPQPQGLCHSRPFSCLSHHQVRPGPHWKLV